MSEVEKQEGQKTVVAFITGLLIGGLLVWVFSSSPEDIPTDNDDTVQIGEETRDDNNNTEDTNTDSDDGEETVKPVVATGDGEINVADQNAGESVTLGDLEFPTNSGWVVVRDYNDGVAGNALGASRYNLNDGLIPTTVELLRSTTVGNTYQVVFFSENENTSFSMKDDTLIDGVGETFEAK